MNQKTIIIGRLGRDPEMRYTPQGTAVTRFSVATDRSWTDQSGQRQDRTTWFRVSAWGKLGELCNQYLTKGRLVMVEGELQEPKPYQSRDGEWRASLDLRATNVQFLGGRGETGAAAAPEREQDQAEAGAPLVDEEEIPF